MVEKMLQCLLYGRLSSNRTLYRLRIKSFLRKFTRRFRWCYSVSKAHWSTFISIRDHETQNLIVSEYISSFMHKPRQALWETAKTVLRYMNNTKLLGNVYTKQEQDLILGFSDAERVSERPFCKFISGYLYTSADAPFSWRNKQRKNCCFELCSSRVCCLIFCNHKSILDTEAWINTTQ